ncbi:MAG: hypothetical protein GY913_14120 [Proteobacteria bacterium]|nr:hypothetical protein [Pseudomonadota bacterium]
MDIDDESICHMAVEVRPLDELERAQQVASPLGAYGLEWRGRLLCHHPTGSNATDRLLDKAGIVPPDGPPS